MVALSIQTLLLMGAAYFIGAALACAIRRSLFAASYQAAERRVDPLPEFVERGADPARSGQETQPAPPPRPVVPPAAPPPPAAAGPQDLKRIRLIDAGIEASLTKLGVNRYEQIAAWTRADVQKVGQALGLKGRINQENWIEQASILAKGGETHYAARRARGETATAAPTPGKGESGPAAVSDAVLPRAMSRAGVAAVVIAPPAAEKKPASAPPAAPPLVSDRAAFAAPPGRSEVQSGLENATLDAVPAVAVRPAVSGRDYLQRIGGITVDIEQGLNAQGVSRYAQIAQWSPSDIDRFEKLLLTGGRIARENWVEQAQILSRGGDTRFSREFDGRDAGTGTAAPATRTDLGTLRSVRSPAYRDAREPGPEDAVRAAKHNKIARGSGPNDLKRIRGIGVLIEKKLNSMGVTTYEHIANWTRDDIDRVSQSLDFKGRIERENWVEQARILSAGGQTEFSRRVDRGEVETSRAKP